MGFDQYHQPRGELATGAHKGTPMGVWLIEEADAVGWYQQRLAGLDHGRRTTSTRSLTTRKNESGESGITVEFLLRSDFPWPTTASGACRGVW